jgi:LacI family transcriptional regulator
MARHVTVADIAREAGVSMMTVSRVINNKGDVSAATRERVQEVVERLDYRPSGIARSLATQHTGTIGLVVPDVSNPFFADVVRGVEHVAYAGEYNVFLCNTEEDPQRELAILQSLEEKRVDGVVLVTRLEAQQLRSALERQPAVVLINRRQAKKRGAPAAVAVLLDDVGGGRAVTQHLLERGHRSIGFLAGPVTSYSSCERAKGYRMALDAAGILPNPDWDRHCSPTVQGGHEAARELILSHPELTALYCYNDLVAVGALQACAELGRAVPGDVAIAGSDDIPLAALVTPPLTTCRAPRYELGGQAVRLLIDQIRGCPDECKEIILPLELVIRASAP